MPYVPLSLDPTEVLYAYGPDSVPQVGVEPGAIDEVRIDVSLKFPGTTRRIWIHRPAGLSATDVCAVMFFNDGWWYLDPQGDVRGSTVLDNLSAAGDIPPMISVFVDPGALDIDGSPTKHRNAEYDAFDASYGSFLLDEVLPRIGDRYSISPDPMMRGVCGGSSGGNAALTAAWCRSDGIGRVIAFNASFAQIPRGNPYPALVQSTQRKPSRIFLHAAHRDLNWNAREDNWFAENLETAAALARAGYDFRLVVGEGGHSPNHGGVLLPDALRWLWPNKECCAATGGSACSVSRDSGRCEQSGGHECGDADSELEGRPGDHQTDAAPERDA